MTSIRAISIYFSIKDVKRNMVQKTLNLELLKAFNWGETRYMGWSRVLYQWDKEVNVDSLIQNLLASA